jgi:Carboxypeptidase regulatory-like domain
MAPAGTEPGGGASKKTEGGMRRYYCLAAALVLVCAIVAPAQEKKKKGEETTRSVQGVVTSGEDTPVSGAVVQLKDTKTLQIRSFISKENGAYYFYELSPDKDYELKADYQGATSGTKTLSLFDSRKKAIINLKLSSKK